MFICDRFEALFIVNFTMSANIYSFFREFSIFVFNPQISDLNFIYPRVIVELGSSLFVMFANSISYTHLYSNV